MPTPKIVVIGDSFSAASVFSRLENLLHQTREPYDLLFITSKPYYCLSPLLPQYMADSCGVEDISEFTRDLNYLRPGISYLQTSIIDIDFTTRSVKTLKGNIDYSFLIIAPDVDDYEYESLPDDEFVSRVSSLNDFRELRKKIIVNLERASGMADQEKRKPLLNFQILGSKEKDIELAFSISDFVRGLLRTKYTDLKKTLLNIEILEGKNNIEASRDPYFNGYLFFNLNKKNIKINTNCALPKENADASFILQTAKDEKSLLIKRLDLVKDDKSKAFVDLYMRAQDKENVFIIWKASRCLDLVENVERSELFYLYQAEVCASNILCSINNNPLKTLKIKFDIDFLSLGSRNAIVEFKTLCLYGIFPWILYRLMYIWYFISWKKKLRAFVSLILTIAGLKDSQLFDSIDEKAESDVLNLTSMS